MSSTPRATQLCISNFGKFMNKNAAKKKLASMFSNAASSSTGGEGSSKSKEESLPAGLLSIDKPFKRTELYLQFDSEESEQQALEAIKRVNDKWEVKIVPVRQRGRGQRRSASDMAADGSGDGHRDKKPRWRSITEAVTPLAHLSYEQQLAQKEHELVTLLHGTFMKDLVKNWKGVSPFPRYLSKHLLPKAANEGESGDSAATGETADKQTDEKAELLHRQETEKLVSQLPFQWEGIVESPVVDGYRNNCEFTCGYTVDGKTAVGFLQGQFQEGFLAISHPEECKNISNYGKRICTLMQNFIDNNKFADTLKCYAKTTHTGFWRLVKLRENLEGHLMVVFQVNPTGVSPETIEQVKQDLVDYMLKNAQGTDGEVSLNFKSMYLQLFDGVSNAAPPDVPMEHIYGEQHIHETVSGVKFQISPMSFFQVNTRGAEKLYEIARNWCAASPDETLLDVCCGTGTIGLTMANSVKRVVGIEIVESAVEDAKRNAELNDIKNAEFICGKAEDTIDRVIRAERAIGGNLTAIVDPPRGGLHPTVLRALARARGLDRLVYVSCNPKTLVKDSLIICSRSKRRDVVPFRPVKAIGCDMFPHTRHCEMVVLFERVKEFDSLNDKTE